VEEEEEVTADGAGLHELGLELQAPDHPKVALRGEEAAGVCEYRSAVLSAGASRGVGLVSFASCSSLLRCCS
jgi:hypothetical protein